MVGNTALLVSSNIAVAAEVRIGLRFELDGAGDERVSSVCTVNRFFFQGLAFEFGQDRLSKGDTQWSLERLCVTYHLSSPEYVTHSRWIVTSIRAMWTLLLERERPCRHGVSKKDAVSRGGQAALDRHGVQVLVLPHARVSCPFSPHSFFLE